MKRNSSLEALVEWLKATGRSKSWFARTIGYSRQTACSKMTGNSSLNDAFVVRCFERVPDLPADVFESQGYVRGDGAVYKKIPLEVAQ